MGWRFQKRIRIAPGLRLNVSKRGLGISMGTRGARLSVGPRGVRTSVGIPGSGLYYVQQQSTGGRRSSRADAPELPDEEAWREAVPVYDAPRRSRRWIWLLLAALIGGCWLITSTPDTRQSAPPQPQRSQPESVPAPSPDPPRSAAPTAEATDPSRSMSASCGRRCA